MKVNPNQLKRLVEHCNNKDRGHVNINANVDCHSKANTSGNSLTDGDLALPKLFQEESLVLATYPNKKPDPFYISLLLSKWCFF